MRELLILMVVIWTSGRLFRLLSLPTVFGELLGGILVGPAMLNLVDADSEIIRVLSELGIFFLMLHTGMKTDPKELLQASMTSVFVGIGGSLLSFLGGYGVGIVFGLDTSAALFLGMGLSVSAIALAARVFKDAKIEESRAANITMGAAVVSDIIALILFSMIMTYAEQGDVTVADMGVLLLKIALFFAVVLWIGLHTGPRLHRYLQRGQKAFTLTLIVALLLGIAAESIGLHSIIGAFLAGLFVQEKFMDTDVFAKIEDRFYGLAYSFFGPVFIASLAFHLDFSAMSASPIFLLLVIAVALAGKFIGGGGVAWLMKIPVRESLIIGLSMNCRGAVELVMASIGRRAGIIDASVFSILVTMAFATTILSMLLTAPLAKRAKITPGTA